MTAFVNVSPARFAVERPKPSKHVFRSDRTEATPFNNMGSENISDLAPLENRSLIDWFAWTVQIVDVREAISACGLSFIDFQPSKGGGMGYKSTLRCGNMVIYFDGSDGMGCHFSFTGQGCRQYEAYKKTAHCWYQLMHHLRSIGASFTRLDLAVDNVDGALDLDLLENDIRSNEVQCRFKGGHKLENFSFSSNPDKQGKTIYLGAPSSRIKIRFYDKAAQMGIDSHWVRCELQCMSERAVQAVNHLLKNVEPGQLAVSVLNNYFRPINSESVNKSQCSTKSWWSSWLITTDKIRLTTAKALKYISEVVDHVKRQYSPTFAMLRKFYGVAAFSELLHDMVNEGKERLNKKHEIIMSVSRPLEEIVCNVQYSVLPF